MKMKKGVFQKAGVALVMACLLFCSLLLLDANKIVASAHGSLILTGSVFSRVRKETKTSVSPVNGTVIEGYKFRHWYEKG